MARATHSPAGDLTSDVIARHDQFMTGNYPRYPIVMQRGLGAELWDAKGKRYIDLFAGFGGPLLGHCHRELVEALHAQASTLWHVGNLFHTEPQTRLAAHLSQAAFGGKSFFCHSGADANEAALKLARIYGRQHPSRDGQPRYKVITTERSFHGRSFATMVATGQSKVHSGFDPLLEGFVHVPYNDLEAMAQAIDETTVAVLVEPIQGEGGVNIPDADYLPGLRKLCDEHDMLLMVDEVWTGCGRTGRWFAHQHDAIVPDVMTLAKGVGGGLAVGVAHVHARLADCFDQRVQQRVVHATTLGGNCVSMAVAAKIFEIIERDGLLEQAARQGDWIVQRLTDMQQRCPAITRVRGRGLFVGVELDLDALDVSGTGELVQRCLDEGLVINACQNHVLRLAPAMTIEQPLLEEGLELLSEQLIAALKA